MAMRTDRFKEIKPTGLAIQVASALSGAILEGDLKGGDQLVEMELQSRFGVSRSPLREAFRELEKQGLVVIVPRKGTYVRKVTRKDVEDIFPVRAELEGLAARLAAVRMTPDVLKEMETLLGMMRTAVEADDAKVYHAHHLWFHEAFIECAGNELLFGLLKNLRTQSMWHRFSYQYYQEDLEKSFAAHRRILELFRASPPKPETVGEHVTAHINVARDRFLAYLEDFGQG
jgi:DNA-binding GntR family transcriptional regulator